MRIESVEAQIFNAILIHVATTWERSRDDNPKAIRYNDEESVGVIQSIARTIMSYSLVQDFIKTRDERLWNKFGDKSFSMYIVQSTMEIIEGNIITTF
jgi:hypothetical protein